MFEHAIVGVDGSSSGRDAIALARILLAVGGRLTLANVRAHEHARAPGKDEEPRRIESEHLLAAERQAADADLVSLSSPSVGRGLHDLAERSGSDLLVVGSCRRGFAGRVLVGNDTRAALNGSPCAIAVAPLAYASNMDAVATVGVGYDGSPESAAALALGRTLASRYGAKLRALQAVVIPGSPWVGVGGGAWGDTLEASSSTLSMGYLRSRGSTVRPCSASPERSSPRSVSASISWSSVPADSVRFAGS